MHFSRIDSDTPLYSRIHIVNTLELQEIVQLVAQVMIVIIIGYRWVTSNKSILQQNSLKINQNFPNYQKDTESYNIIFRIPLATFEKILPSAIT